MEEKKNLIFQNLEKYKKKEISRKIFFENLKFEKEEMKNSYFFVLKEKNEDFEKKKILEFEKKLKKIKKNFLPMEFKEINNFSKKNDKRKKKLLIKRKKLLSLSKMVFKKELKPLIEKYKKNKNLSFSEKFEKNFEKKKLLKNKSQFSLKVKKLFLPKISKKTKKMDNFEKPEKKNLEKEKQENYKKYLKIRKKGHENLEKSKKLIKSFKIKKKSKIKKKLENLKKNFENFKSEKIFYKNYLQHNFSEKNTKINILKNFQKKNKENILNPKIVNKMKFYFDLYDNKLMVTNKFESKKVLDSIQAKINFLNKINK